MKFVISGKKITNHDFLAGKFGHSNAQKEVRTEKSIFAMRLKCFCGVERKYKEIFFTLGKIFHFQLTNFSQKFWKDFEFSRIS